MSSELLLATGAMEAGFVHAGGSSGFFSILVQADNGTKRQMSHRLRDMPQVLHNLNPSMEAWISQNQFTCGNRRAVNLLRIGLLFADLDTYLMSWAAGLNPDQLANLVLNYCTQEGIPKPSLLVYSGRGLQAKWLLKEGRPKHALPRWNACQRFLGERLSSLGADPRARDVSRVLRLVSTPNRKSGRVCTLVHLESGLDRQPIRYDFEELADLLLPVSRLEIEQQRHENQARRQSERQRSGSELGRFCKKQLAWDRLCDLRELAAMRGGIVEGKRMEILFWSVNFLLLSGTISSSDMYREASILARELAPGWSDYRSQELMTLHSKAKQHEAGKTVGTPLYTPENDTLINRLEITDAEQRKLRTIISKKIKAERRRKKEEAQRRRDGMAPRQTYLDEANNKRLKARELRSQGLSVRAIAAKLGFSKSAVGKYLVPGT